MGEEGDEALVVQILDANAAERAGFDCGDRMGEQAMRARRARQGWDAPVTKGNEDGWRTSSSLIVRSIRMYLSWA